MKALILAAGYATRLYPYTKNFPKPLLTVDRKPIIQYLVEKLDAMEGLAEIMVVTNDRFFKRFQRWQRSLHTTTGISIINDGTRTVKERLGAVGDMNFVFAQRGFDDDYLVLGGDNFFDESLQPFVASAKKNSPYVTIGVCDIRTISEARHYGVVRLTRAGKITGFWEKPLHPAGSTVAMCLYYFPKKRVTVIRDYLAKRTHQSDAAGSYIQWLSTHDTVYGHTFKNYWVDIGHIHTYHTVRQRTKGGKT